MRERGIFEEVEGLSIVSISGINFAYNKFICSFDPNFFLRGGFTKNELKKKIKVPVYLLY
ncbi:hypothetical protein C5S32_08100 [ANME-1 cluster archaeon GoMg1]|nr:hypothetical protein [ANME-1 cluster archaeon GoMg1]